MITPEQATRILMVTPSLTLSSQPFFKGNSVDRGPITINIKAYKHILAIGIGLIHLMESPDVDSYKSEIIWVPDTKMTKEEIASCVALCLNKKIAVLYLPNTVAPEVRKSFEKAEEKPTQEYRFMEEYYEQIFGKMNKPSATYMSVLLYTRCGIIPYLEDVVTENGEELMELLKGIEKTLKTKPAQ